MDEPTNDLDISTLCVLEDYLDTFPGILITVSHDRYFLDRVARRMLTFEENGKIELYNGSYTEYFQEKGEQLWEDDTPQNGEKRSAEDWKEQKSQNRKLKFSYKEQKEYETIEAEIEALENQIAALEQEMGKAATDFVKLNQITKEKEEAERKLEEKLERYVYLSELAEKIAAQ